MREKSICTAIHFLHSFFILAVFLNNIFIKVPSTRSAKRHKETTDKTQPVGTNTQAYGTSQQPAK
jgi:hypothetical protein